jgi:hypothetical protein
VWLLSQFRNFQSTGPLIRMILQIMSDMKAFMLVLVVGIIAFASFFVIHQPSSESFTVENELLGPIWPLLTVFRLVLGDFDVGDFQSSLAIVVFAISVLFASILLLNLLIAIMGDSCKFLHNAAASCKVFRIHFADLLKEPPSPQMG